VVIHKPKISKSANDGGRGAGTNPHNRFLSARYESTDEAVMWWQEEELDEEKKRRTSFIEVHPKSILSENNSPDIPFRYSINPYNGCEHGCVYCYARNSHEYWGYSAGRDFEEKILYKPDAPQMLRKIFQSGKWKPELIVLSGNTDCYQPVERQMMITRKLLEVFLEHRHPVGIITKNALILRDLDLLCELNKQNLVSVIISVTTLHEELRRAMEPRTSSVTNRLKAIETLSAAGIQVGVNMAPIIPGLNSDEIFTLVEEVAKRGAVSVGYIMARLNGQIATIFEDWIKATLPERADKVLQLIRETHGGTLNESRWKTRMKGEGHYADNISAMFKVAKRKFLPNQVQSALDYSNFTTGTFNQMKLF
jgi:DNA repair photolyase